MQAVASLESQDVKFEVYDKVVSEPTEASWRDAIAWARQHDCSHFLAYVHSVPVHTSWGNSLPLFLQCGRRKRHGHRKSRQPVRHAELSPIPRLANTVCRFTVYKDADLFDFINAPVGKGLPIEEKLRPLIAVPTTAGTGSETTGTAILDITSMNFKTGIANRAMKPTLGIVDTLNTRSCSRGNMVHTRFQDMCSFS